VKAIDWKEVLTGPRFLGLRFGLAGVFVGFLAFLIALCGLVNFGVAIFAIALSISLTGFVLHISRMRTHR